MNLLDRRQALMGLGAGVGATMLSGCGLLSPELPADRSLLLKHPTRNLLSWPDALGYTLAPIEGPELEAAWAGIWDRLPDAKWACVKEFRLLTDAPPIKENLARMEAVIQKMTWGFGGSKVNGIIDLIYERMFAHRAFVELAYPDGGYDIGRADPQMLAEYGIKTVQDREATHES